MESLTVAETETEDDSASIDIEGKLQSTAESTNNIVKNCMSIYNYIFYRSGRRRSVP